MFFIVSQVLFTVCGIITNNYNILWMLLFWKCSTIIVKDRNFMHTSKNNWAYIIHLQNTLFEQFLAKRNFFKSSQILEFMFLLMLIKDKWYFHYTENNDKNLNHYFVKRLSIHFKQDNCIQCSLNYSVYSTNEYNILTLMYFFFLLRWKVVLIFTKAFCLCRSFCWL